MTKIITDTSSLLSINEANELGVDLLPLVVTIDKKSYNDYLDINATDFIEIIDRGNIPTSSQPPIGQVVECYESTDEEVLNITITSGLSGTYNSAVDAKNMASNKDKVTVMDSTTICGPQNYMVKLAVKMAKEGCNVKTIVDTLSNLIKGCESFLVPFDFNYLKRGGRLTPLAATIGGLLKIVPITTTINQGQRIEKYGIGRTLGDAFNKIANELVKRGVTEDDYVVFVSHGNNEKAANEAINRIKKMLPNIEIQVMQLSPAFITQGGPHCVAIQYIRKYK